MSDYISEYNVYLSLIKKASKNTIASYSRDLEKYFSYAKEKNIKDICNVSQEFIESYLKHLFESGMTVPSVCRARSTLNGFYKFLYSINKSKSIKIPKPSFSSQDTKDFPTILTQYEIKKLISNIDVSDLKGIRDKAMIQLMYASGIKVSELLELRVSDINFNVGLISLSNRKIPIYNDALKTLSLYFKEVRPILCGDSDKLFLNMSGSVLTRQGFWKILKLYALSAGIDKPITPNSIRHSFAVHLLENGANINDVCEMLGNSDVSSMQVYIKLIKTNSCNSLLKFHPMSQN